MIRHRDGAEPRRRLYDALRERDIFCQVHYLPVHLHPYYRDTYGYGPGDFPAGRGLLRRLPLAPCFPDLSESDQRRVVDSIRELV